MRVADFPSDVIGGTTAQEGAGAWGVNGNARGGAVDDDLAALGLGGGDGGCQAGDVFNAHMHAPVAFGWGPDDWVVAAKAEAVLLPGAPVSILVFAVPQLALLDFESERLLPMVRSARLVTVT